MVGNFGPQRSGTRRLGVTGVRVFLVVPCWFMALVAFESVTALTPPESNFTEWKTILHNELNNAAGGDQQKPVTFREAPSGDFIIPVILFRFQGHENRTLPPVSYFDTQFNGVGQSVVNPIGSIHEWLRYNSLGKFTASFDVFDWHDTNNTEAYFAQGVSGLVSKGLVQDMFAPVLEQLDAEGVDWSRYDTTGSGVLDHIVVLHSGYGAENGNVEPWQRCTDNVYQDRIWSQGTNFSSGSWISSDGKYRIGAFALTSAYDPDLCQEKPAQMGIMTHEFMHGVGLLDFYDQDPDDVPITKGGLGNYDIMSSPTGWTRDLTRPGHLSAWSRMLINWVEAIELVSDGVYVIQPAEISSQIYVIRQNFPPGEYLLIENRQPIKWDGDRPPGGIVIYHVDDTAPLQTQRGYPGHPNWPAEHYQIAVLQADGKYEIEKGISDGDQGDFWTEGAILGPGNSSAEEDVWPNTDSYQGGVQRSTGITITVLNGPGFIMSFRVTGLSASSPTDASTNITPTFRDGKEPAGDNAPYTTKSSGTYVLWVLSTLSGVGLMVGLLAFVF